MQLLTTVNYPDKPTQAALQGICWWCPLLQTTPQRHRCTSPTQFGGSYVYLSGDDNVNEVLESSELGGLVTYGQSAQDGYTSGYTEVQLEGSESHACSCAVCTYNAQIKYSS